MFVCWVLRCFRQAQIQPALSSTQCRNQHWRNTLKDSFKLRLYWSVRIKSQRLQLRVSNVPQLINCPASSIDKRPGEATLKWIPGKAKGYKLKIQRVSGNNPRNQTRKWALKGSWKQREYTDYQRRERVPQVGYNRDKNAKMAFAVHPWETSQRLTWLAKQGHGRT